MPPGSLCTYPGPARICTGYVPGVHILAPTMPGTSECHLHLLRSMLHCQPNIPPPVPLEKTTLLRETFPYSLGNSIHSHRSTSSEEN